MSMLLFELGQGASIRKVRIIYIYIKVVTTDSSILVFKGEL